MVIFVSIKVCYYQLLLDFGQGIRENFMKPQVVRVRVKVKSHCLTHHWSSTSPLILRQKHICKCMANLYEDVAE